MGKNAQLITKSRPKLTEQNYCANLSFFMQVTGSSKNDT